MPDKWDERAREWLSAHDGDRRVDAVASLAALLRRVAEEERAGAADFLDAKANKLGEDAKTIELGARSARRTFLERCPAWDVEQFVAGIIREQAAAVRARSTSEPTT
jgi:hypothetical protein